MTQDQFLQPIGPFLDWFKTWPGTTFHPDIEIVDLRGRDAGRGIVAKADIAPDTVLFTIPRKAVICSATSELASLIPALGKRPEQDAAAGDGQDSDEDERPGQDPWTSLILVMMYEFLRGASSPWKPYLDMLPATFDTPMFWTAEELRELQASPVVERIGKAEADEMITQKVLPVIRAHSDVFFSHGAQPLSDAELVGLAHRMGSTILAYSFSLESDEEDEEEEGEDEKPDKQDKPDKHDGSDEEMADAPQDKGADQDDNSSDSDSGSEYRWVEDKDDQLPLGMVPMADMLNADAEFNAHINHGTNVLTATSMRAIRAGEEILNYYGPLSNGELMRRYGYTTEKHEHFDAVDLAWKLVQDALVSKLKLSPSVTEKITASLDMNEFEDPIMIDREFEEDGTEGRLAAPNSGKVLSQLPPVLRRQARAFAKRAMHEQKKAKNDSKLQDETVVSLSAIATALATRLKAYPTTLAADVAKLQGLVDTEPTATTNRLRMALRVRIGEKRLLAEATALAKEAVEAAKAKAKASDKTSTDQHRDAKRQRRR